MKVCLELPDSMADLDESYLKEALVATLYSTGKLSGRQAREALGMTRRAFEEVLPRYGFSIMLNSQENLDLELKGAVVPPPLGGGAGGSGGGQEGGFLLRPENSGTNSRRISSR